MSTLPDFEVDLDEYLCNYKVVEGGQHVAAQSLESSSNAAGHPVQHSLQVLPLIKANTHRRRRQLENKIRS